MLGLAVTDTVQVRFKAGEISDRSCITGLLRLFRAQLGTVKMHSPVRARMTKRLLTACTLRRQDHQPFVRGSLNVLLSPRGSYHHRDRIINARGHSGQGLVYGPILFAVDTLLQADINVPVAAPSRVALEGVCPTCPCLKECEARRFRDGTLHKQALLVGTVLFNADPLSAAV